jgi:threonine/homoserine/homoserine lactone efflux protein
MLPYLLQGLVLGFSAVASPGPLITFLVSQTLSNGFRRSWPAAFAPLISDGPIIAVTLLVLSKMPALLQRGLYIASGLFILYLAFGAWKGWRDFRGITVDADDALGFQRVLKATLMNLINPFPYIYWSLVTGATLLSGWHESPAYGLIFLVAFYSVLVGGFLAIMGLFGAARSLGDRVSKAMLGLSVIALAVFGIFQLWRGIAV